MKTRRKQRKKQFGGAGQLRRIIDLNDSKLLGSGGYGIVLTVPNPNEAVKLFYSVEDCNALRSEARLQNKIRKLLQNIIHVPYISDVLNNVTTWSNHKYLCGIVMEKIPMHPDFGELVHMILGYHGSDLDQSWGRESEKAVSSENPSRGYYASSEMLEAIWTDDTVIHTIESVAKTIGLAYRALVLGGIVPIDIEWIYGGDGQIHAIDFGLCVQKGISLERLLEQRGAVGFPMDIYVPKQGDKGYTEFITAYLYGY